MFIHKSLRLGLVWVAALMLISCDAVTTTEIIDKSFDVNESPVIMVETFNGHITVIGGAASRVQVSVTKRGSGSTQTDAEEDLVGIEVTTWQEGNTVRIIAFRADRVLVGNSGASIDLVVPDTARLELITNNGPIQVSGISGAVRAQTFNSGIEILQGSGQIDVSTDSGRIQIEAIDAHVTVQATNAPIFFSGTLIAGTHLFITTNRTIEIRLPADTSFRIDAESRNGSVLSEFAVASSVTSRTDELHGTVGANPLISIEANTSNDDIMILYK